MVGWPRRCIKFSSSDQGSICSYLSSLYSRGEASFKSSDVRRLEVKVASECHGPCLRLTGYEPKPLRLICWALAGIIRYVWWSAWANTEQRLQALRPSDLPRPTDLSEAASRRESGEAASAGLSMAGLEYRSTSDGRSTSCFADWSDRPDIIAAAVELDRQTSIGHYVPERAMGFLRESEEVLQDPQYFTIHSGGNTPEEMRRAGTGLGSAGEESRQRLTADFGRHSSGSNTAEETRGRAQGVDPSVHAVGYLPGHQRLEPAAGRQRRPGTQSTLSEEQVRSLPVRELYGALDTTGRRDPLLLALVHRLEEAEARTRSSASFHSVAELGNLSEGLAGGARDRSLRGGELYGSSRGNGISQRVVPRMPELSPPSASPGPLDSDIRSSWTFAPPLPSFQQQPVPQHVRSASQGFGSSFNYPVQQRDLHEPQLVSLGGERQGSEQHPSAQGLPYSSQSVGGSSGPEERVTESRWNWFKRHVEGLYTASSIAQPRMSLLPGAGETRAGSQLQGMGFGVHNPGVFGDEDSDRGRRGCEGPSLVRPVDTTPDLMNLDMPVSAQLALPEPRYQVHPGPVATQSAVPAMHHQVHPGPVATQSAVPAMHHQVHTGPVATQSAVPAMHHQVHPGPVATQSAVPDGATKNRSNAEPGPTVRSPYTARYTAQGFCRTPSTSAFRDSSKCRPYNGSAGSTFWVCGRRGTTRKPTCRECPVDRCAFPKGWKCDSVYALRLWHA